MYRVNCFRRIFSGLLFGAFALSLCACGSSNQSQSAAGNANAESDSNAALYEAMINTLSEDETPTYTAIIETNGTTLLLVTTEPWDDEEGHQASTWCDVYAAVNGNVENVGTIESSGTSYPIAYDATWLYSASPHSLRCYQLDEATGTLELKEQPYVTFDTDGNESYFLEKNGETAESTEEVYNTAYDGYNNATIVSFS